MKDMYLYVQCERYIQTNNIKKSKTKKLYRVCKKHFNLPMHYVAKLYNIK